MKAVFLAGVACLSLSACATAPASAPPLAETPQSTVPARLAWNDFVKASVDQWFAIDPYFAVYQGDHRFDGKLPDWSAAGFARRGDFMRKLIADAESYTGLSAADAFERDYLIHEARKDLFWTEDARKPFANPAYYIDNGLDPNVYIARNYGDKPARMRAMIAFLRNIPQATANIRANLATPMPASFVNHGVSGFGGFASYYRKDVRQAFADVSDPALQAELSDASTRAADAMQGLADWVKAQKPTATGNFALGADRFSRMLKITEEVDMPLDQLEAVGRADLARNQAAMKQACAVYAPRKTIEQCLAKLNAEKPAGGPVAAATAQLPMLTAFVRERDLVSIPGTEQALVRESPPYNAQNGAYIDPPGPFDKGVPSVYYIAPPDPSWSKAKQLEYIPGKNDLLFTSVHEVMPGHFLQFLHSNRSPSLVGQLFVGYAFAEGWAHYSEEMMWEAGLGNGDAGVHVGQLSNALLRDCRFISAIGLHAGSMTQAQSEQLFRDQCYQGAGTAEQQAARGTYDPAYLNYTLGKLMIRKLREDWTASRGGRSAWKAFHDQFLSYGGPPIPMVRAAMMGEAAPRAAF